MGLTWEDLEPGRSFTTAARTVSAADVAAFAELSGDRSALHGPEAAASGSAFGEPVAHGVLGLAVATGLMSQSGITEGTLVALLGVRWDFRAPVRFGDTLTARLRVAHRRETSSPARGVVTFAAEVVTQRGEVVQEGEIVELVRRRSSLPNP